MNARARRVVLPLLCVIGALSSPDLLLATCGVERWSVKTGTDADAGLVNVNSTSPNTIVTMRGWTAPSPIPANNRVAPFETTVWVLNATLTQYKLETDQDYHLVLADASGNTMIAEIPDPACVGTGSPFAAGISNARAEFDAKFNATSSFQTANVPVRITGVGMFDFLHGQTGVAPNGIELHAVLDVVFNPTSNPDFAISAAPGSVTAAQGSSAGTTVTTTVSGGFNAAVALSASGLPSGASASFSPASIGAPGAGSSAVTLAAGTAAAGTYTVTITGTGGGKSHAATVSFTVTPSGGCTPGELFADNGFESGTAPAGTTGTSGTSGPWVWTSSGSNNPVAAASASATAHAGSWLAWVNGYGSAETDSLYQQAAIPAGASATLSFWLKVTTAETTTTAQNDKLQVQVLNSGGTVLATLATYSNLNASSAYAQKTFDLSAYAGQTIRVKLTGTENASLATSFFIDDVSLATKCSGGDTTPPTTSITAPAGGATVSGTANVTATAADNVGVTKIEIYVDGALKASNTSAGSLTFAWNTTTVANGAHTLQSKAYDAAGNVGTSAAVSVTVANSTGSQQLLGNPGFENGSSSPAPWSASSGVIDNSAGEAAHSGSWKAWLDGYGAAHTDTVQQTVTLPAGIATATLSFWLHVDTAETSTTTAFDTLTVQVRSSAGSVLATLATYSNLNAGTGFVQRSFDVSAFKGQTIQVYLVGTEDGSLQTSFVVDDFALNVQ